MPTKKLLNLTTHRSLRASTPTPQISDGKRPRTLWIPSHGDGDPSPDIANRSLNLTRGHPTWKIFCGNISLPITRPAVPVTTTTTSISSLNTPSKSTRKRKTNSQPNQATLTPNTPLPRHPSEPPRFVYLDDHAAYTILASSAYTNAELRAFWPFDFDNRGGVKAGRGNRGRAAVLGEAAGGGFATWATQAKARVYLFCGGGDTGVLKEFATGEKEGVEKRGLGRGESEINGGEKKIEADQESLHANEAPAPRIPLYHAHIPYTLHQPVVYTSGPTDGTLKPLGIAARAIEGSPYFEEPCAKFRTKPRSRPGDLAKRLGIVVGKRGREGENVGDRDRDVEGMRWTKKRVRIEEREGKKKEKGESTVKSEEDK